MSLEQLAKEFLDNAYGLPNRAAADMAKNLMAGDPATLKAGYSRESAILTALEVFPQADPGAVRDLVGYDDKSTAADVFADVGTLGENNLLGMLNGLYSDFPRDYAGLAAIRANRQLAEVAGEMEGITDPADLRRFMARVDEIIQKGWA